MNGVRVITNTHATSLDSDSMGSEEVLKRYCVVVGAHKSSGKEDFELGITFSDMRGSSLLGQGEEITQTKCYVGCHDSYAHVSSWKR